jgi:hypothetical protein
MKKILVIAFIVFLFLPCKYGLVIDQFFRPYLPNVAPRPTLILLYALGFIVFLLGVKILLNRFMKRSTDEDIDED